MRSRPSPLELPDKAGPIGCAGLFLDALKLPFNQHFLNKGDISGRIEPFWTCLATIADAVAPVKPKRGLRAHQVDHRWPRHGCPRSSDKPATRPPVRDNDRRSTTSLDSRQCSGSTGRIHNGRRVRRVPRAIEAAPGQVAAVWLLSTKARSWHAG